MQQRIHQWVRWTLFWHINSMTKLVLNTGEEIGQCRTWNRTLGCQKICFWVLIPHQHWHTHSLSFLALLSLSRTLSKLHRAHRAELSSLPCSIPQGRDSKAMTSSWQFYCAVPELHLGAIFSLCWNVHELWICHMPITVLILLFSQECHKSVSFFQDCNTIFSGGNAFRQWYLQILHFPVHRQRRQLSEMAVSSILFSLAPVPGTQVPFLSLLTKGNLWGRGDGLGWRCSTCTRISGPGWLLPADVGLNSTGAMTTGNTHLEAPHSQKTAEQIAQVPPCPSKHVCAAPSNMTDKRHHPQKL